MGLTACDSSTDSNFPMSPYTVPPDERNTSLPTLCFTQMSSKYSVPITFDWISNSGDSLELLGVVVLTQCMTASKPDDMSSSKAPTFPKSPVTNEIPAGD